MGYREDESHVDEPAYANLPGATWGTVWRYEEDPAQSAGRELHEEET